MAIYKYARYLSRSLHSVFDRTHAPGEEARHSGIYRCDGCGREIVAGALQRLPAAGDHAHAPTQGAVRWRLVVYAQTAD